MLDRVNPTGRVDVLVFRLVERFAMRHCPHEWGIFKPYVEKWTRKKLSPRRVRRRKR